MPPTGLSAAVTRARRAVVPADSRTDGALLAAFVAARDGEAFAALVDRFGPMVFAVCRRHTGHHQDAEDAFQAVFVVLARKAAGVAVPEAVGGWLYGVAVRTAREARTMAARRAARETPTARLPDAACGAAPPDADLSAVIDAELAALPEKDRALLVRCDLRDESQVAVAAALGVPVGTVYSRLAAARKRLAARLTARGVAPGVGGLMVALGGTTHALPADLHGRAVASALAPESAPAAVAALSHGVLRAMSLHTLRLAPPALAAVAAAALAAGLLAAPPAPDAPPVRVAAAAAPPPTPRPLPKGPNKILVYKSGKLVLIDPDGKNETVAADEPAGPLPSVDSKLSPDGKRVALLRTVGRREDMPPDQPPRRKLVVRPVGGKGEDLDTGAECDIYLWSPDGTKLVACAVDGKGGNRIPEATALVVDASTGKTTPLKLPSNHIVTGWLPGDKFLTTAFAGTEEAPKVRLYLMNADGTEHKALTDETSLVGFGLPSPDGKRVVCFEITVPPKDAPPGARRTPVVLDVATGTRSPIDGLPLNGELTGVCWSPDGKKIAYTWRQLHEGTVEERLRKETESHLVVADADGRNPRTILTEKAEGQWVISLGGPDWR